MNDNDIKISVLITFYNQERFVDKALASVFSQNTDFQYKVIIGDDGSSDGTLDKVHYWQDKYPEQISVICQPRLENETNIGGSRASRNRLALLKMVDTPYFIFLDGDDYWTDDNKLQIQYEILSDKKNIDCIASAHQIAFVCENNKSKIRMVPERMAERKLTLKEYWGRHYFHTDTILFRSEYINDIPYDVLNEMFNDNIITYTFMQYGKIHYLPRNMAAYYQNNQGIWAGEKTSICMIRNIMSYDIEIMLNKALKNISIIRHLQEFIYFRKNRDSVKSINGQYLIIAKKYSLKTTERILQGEPMFGLSFAVDKILIFFFRILRKINHLTA